MVITMKENKRISLCGDWTLTYIENKPFRQSGKNPATAAELLAAGWHHIDAKVPGNFELDFERAGLTGDPFFGCNTIDLEKYENLHLFYSRKFDLDFEPDENTFLHFDGIDTIADIFVNGILIGSTDNMLVPFEFGKQGLRKGENEIVVHITPAHIAARAYEVPVTSTSTTSLS